MKIRKPLKLFVPSIIHDEILKFATDKTKDKYFYIVHSLLYTHLCKKKNEEKEFVVLNYKKIQNVISTNPIPYIKKLRKCEIINCDGIFEKGKKKYHYQINPKLYLDCNFIDISIRSKLYDNIMKQVRCDRSHISLLPPYQQQMFKKFLEINFDYKAAFDWILTVQDLNKQLSYTMAMNAIENKNLRYFKRNMTNNRLDTNLTNLKKELRRFIINDDFINIDLKNSQPFFLSILLESIMNINTTRTISYVDNNNDLSVINCWFSKINKKSLFRKNQIFVNFAKLKIEISELKTCTLQGKFYERFMSKFPGVTRDDVKSIMFAVLFSRNWSNNGIPYVNEKKVFASVFPEISKVIEIIKQRHHERLSIMLQRIEANIFIDTICPILVNNNIIPLTIHDSIMVEEKHKNKALGIIQDVFYKRFGVVPTFELQAQKRPEKSIYKWLDGRRYILVYRQAV